MLPSAFPFGLAEVLGTPLGLHGFRLSPQTERMEGTGGILTGGDQSGHPPLALDTLTNHSFFDLHVFSFS